MMNDTILKRRSIRKYQNFKISDEELYNNIEKYKVVGYGKIFTRRKVTKRRKDGRIFGAHF